jgi:3-isopropylmalate/(R)-2-methylmalate dehydratase small subunit
MTFEGRAVLVPGDDVDTDVLYPGPYLNIDDPEEMRPFLFEGLDPTLRNRLGGDTVLVVGANFGIGSSREHVPVAMKAWGVRGIVAPSFARIFYRNCINLGLPAVQSAEAAALARDDSWIRVDPADGTIDVDGTAVQATKLPPFVLEAIRLGGLVEWARAHLAAEAR